MAPTAVMSCVVLCRCPQLLCHIWRTVLYSAPPILWVLQRQVVLTLSVRCPGLRVDDIDVPFRAGTQHPLISAFPQVLSLCSAQHPLPDEAFLTKARTALVSVILLLVIQEASSSLHLGTIVK